MQPPDNLAYPIPVVPVYYIHSFEQPFCENLLCQCHLTKQEASRLFVQIVEGKLELEKAQDVSGRTV